MNAVAQIGGHVAMVKSVNDLGTITVEEYNWGIPVWCGQRTTSARTHDFYIHIVDSFAPEVPDSASAEDGVESSVPQGQGINGLNLEALRKCTP